MDTRKYKIASIIQDAETCFFVNHVFEAIENTEYDENDDDYQKQLQPHYLPSSLCSLYENGIMQEDEGDYPKNINWYDLQDIFEAYPDCNVCLDCVMSLINIED